ncbi:hypothetical protein FY534_07720 [Alicyclobacillus sp. TC]|nr:hypothetical protein FY534_07720 [Alicyclobacillus sp. TC]
MERQFRQFLPRRRSHWIALGSVGVFLVVGGTVYLLEHARASYPAPGTGYVVGTPGTITSSYTITRGTQLKLENHGINNTVNDTDPTTQGADGATFEFADPSNPSDANVGVEIATMQGSGAPVPYMHFQETKTATGAPVNQGGGYLFIAPHNTKPATPNQLIGTNLLSWIQALNGSPNYITYHDATPNTSTPYPEIRDDWFTTSTNGGFSGSTTSGETLVNLSYLVQQAGDAFIPTADENTKDQNDGAQFVMVKPNVTAQLGLGYSNNGLPLWGGTGSSRIQGDVPQGSVVFAFDQVSLGSWYQTSHLEYLNVTNSQGQSVNNLVFPDGQLAAFQSIGATPQGVNYTVWGPQDSWYMSQNGLTGGMIPVAGGGVGTPSDYGSPLFNAVTIGGAVPSGMQNTYINGDLVNGTHDAQGEDGSGNPENFTVNGGGGNVVSGGNLVKGVPIETKNLAPGTYTVTLYAGDDVGTFAAPVSQTFTVTGGANVPKVTLSATPTQLPSGSSSTLTAQVIGQVPGNYTVEIMDDGADNTLNGASQAQSPKDATQFTTEATYYGNLTDQFTAEIVSTSTGQAIATSQPVQVTWGNPSPPSPPPSTYCGVAYDTDEYYTNDGTPGSQVFHWTEVIPTEGYKWVGTGKNRHQVPYCYNVYREYTKMYPSIYKDGQISGLVYDPGYPGHMWLPIPANQWDNPTIVNPYSYAMGSAEKLWDAMDAAHGWPGWQNMQGKGGPQDNQISSTIPGYDRQTHQMEDYHGYMNPYYPRPWGFLRPGAGFSFRVVWMGSPDALPDSATVTFTMVNPDGSKRTWQEPVYFSKSLRMGFTQMQGFNDPPLSGYDVFMGLTPITPKHTINANGQPEMSRWSLSPDYSVVQEDDTKINAVVTLHFPNGTATYSIPDVMTEYNYPKWFFNGWGLTPAWMKQIVTLYDKAVAAGKGAGYTPNGGLAVPKNLEAWLK